MLRSLGLRRKQNHHGNPVGQHANAKGLNFQGLKFPLFGFSPIHYRTIRNHHMHAFLKQ